MCLHYVLRQFSGGHSKLFTTASEGWERYCFHRCLSIHIGGGGVERGFPSPMFFPRPLVPGPSWGVAKSWPGWYLSPGWGYHIMGYPTARSGWGTPCPSQVRIGYPLPGQDGVPSPGQNWGTPPPLQTEQQSEHLVRGGQYASCVHAGLSCVFITFTIRP